MPLHTDPVRQNANPENQIQVIHRAGMILRAIRESGELSLSQLTREVGLAHSTVHRIVSSLETEGFLNVSPANGKIQLGFQFVHFAEAVKTDLRREIRPYMERLSLEIDETVDFAVLDNSHVLFLDQVVRPHRLNAVSGVGRRFPAFCTANGKAILATLSREHVDKILPQELPCLTPRTPTNRADLYKELDVISRQGVAFDREEHTEGICAVGAALPACCDQRAALSVPVPSVRFYGNEELLAKALRNTIQQITTHAGFM